MFNSLLPRVLVLALCAVAPLWAAHAADGRIAGALPKGSIWDMQWVAGRQALEAAGIELEYFLNGELGGEEEAINAVRRNRIQLGATSLAAVSAVVPELSVALAPFLFDSPEEVDYIYDNHLFPVMRGIAAKRGLHMLGWNEVGWSHIYSKTPIRVPGDLKGLRIRGPVNIAHQAFLTATGADSTPIGLADLVPAIQTGLIDGGLANIVLHTALTAKFADHFTLTYHIYDTGLVFANARWFDGLPAEKQKVLTEILAANKPARDQVRAVSDQLIAGLRADGASHVYDLTAGERAAWKAAASGAYDTIVAESGEDAALVMKAIQEGKAAFAAMAPAQR